MNILPYPSSLQAVMVSLWWRMTFPRYVVRWYQSTTTTTPPLIISCSLMMSFLPPHHPQLMWSLSWAFGVSWYGILFITHLMKRQGLGGFMENIWEQVGGPWETTILWQPQNIVENSLLMRINGGGSSSPTRSIYATTKAEISKKIQGVIAYSVRDSTYVLC